MFNHHCWIIYSQKLLLKLEYPHVKFRQNSDLILDNYDLFFLFYFSMILLVQQIIMLNQCIFPVHDVPLPEIACKICKMRYLSGKP